MRTLQVLLVAAGLAVFCTAYPHRAPNDPIRAGSYSLVMGKGPVPSIMQLKIQAGPPPDWTVAGSFSHQRVSLSIAGKLINSTGILSGKATPSNGYSGKGCAVEGLWGHDRLVVKLGAPYSRRFELKRQGP